MALPAITPGSSPQFRLIPSPAGIPTSIDQIGWAVETSDSTTFDLTMTSHPGDPTGMTAILAVPLDIPVGSTITFWCVYRNLSGLEAVGGPWVYSVASG